MPNKVVIGEQRLRSGVNFDLVWGPPHSTEESRTYASSDSWEDPIVFAGHQRRLDVSFREFNDLRGNLGIYPSGECVITVDEFQVYGFDFVHVEGALIRAWNVIDQLKQLSGWLFGTELFGRREVENLLLGRAVYVNHVPAVVDNFEGESGMVVMRAATESGFFPLQPDELAPTDNGEEVEPARHIRVDMLSREIIWFRNPVHE